MTSDTKRVLIGVGAAMTALVLGIVLIIGMGSNTPTSTVGLKPGAVPAMYAPWVMQAGTLCPQVSPPLIAAQIQAESGWNPHTAPSPVGAVGLAQFLPSTWKTWGRDDDHNGIASPTDPADAIMAMGRYDCALAQQVARLPGDPVANMLAAYNAGPAAVLHYGGVPPYPETQAYVTRIETLISTYAQTIVPGAPASGFGSRVVAAAARWLGTPYAWGGGGPFGPTPGIGRGAATVGFDCSGLVLYAVYQASGGRILLPHSSQLQATLGEAVPRSQMQPGDVIAFALGGGGIYDHIAIYIGDGQIIEAPHTGDVVKIQTLAAFAGVPWSIRRFG